MRKRASKVFLVSSVSGFLLRLLRLADLASTRRQCQYDDAVSALPLPAPKRKRPQYTFSKHPSDLVAPNNFPIAYFLDSDLFRHCNLVIEKPEISLPIAKFDAVESLESTRYVASRFFESVYSWLPIISPTKLYGSLLQHSLQKDAGLAMLILCMQIMLPPQLDKNYPPHRTYTAIKHHLVELEQAGFLAISVLQAMILVAFYEIGHGIYPAAYMTIGHCARYALALNLDKDIFVWSPGSSDWMAMEENHRVWWAVVILER